MPKVRISKVEPNEKELKVDKLLEKNISKIKTIEKGTKSKTKSAKTKTSAAKAKTTTRKTKEEEREQ